tara:strand:+ start:1904 stop:3211 length:1308 start_codon:yes stop_codon:yes gene_type:complete
MDPILTGLIGLGAMFLMIILHIPIGIAMGLTGLVGVATIIGWGPAVSLLGTEPSSAIANEGLAVLALFLLMGAFAGAGGLSADIYRMAYSLVGHWRGGLCMATVGGCAGFGAVCGSSVATTATMARIALPEMLNRGYRPTLASGVIAAGGTLGMLIPPSVVMILYGILTEQFVIALFAAAIIPGLLTVAFYFATIAIYVRISPDAGPAGPRVPWAERLVVVGESWRVIVLAIVVSGGIYSGVFTVTEAAAVGASLAFIFTALRGRMNRRSFLNCLGETAANTGLIFTIIIGASIFSYFVTLSQLPGAVVDNIEALNLHPLLVILLLQIMYLILGSIFDTIAAMVITLPFVYPLVIGMGYDPIWWGVVNVMVMEIGMITPPIGINVFVLHGMAKDLPLKTIFTGITPFFIADICRLAVVTLFPSLALWLPQYWGLL